MRKLKLDKEALFVRLGYVPHAGQLEVHRSIARLRLLACGVRWGKTLCAAIEALCAALEARERSMGWIVAPTYDLAEKVFREVVMLAYEHMPHRVIELRRNEKTLVLKNLGGGRSEIRAKTADNPVSLLGEGLDWVILDEAARMRPEIWQSYLSQRLIDRKGWALLISTPRGKGWFYDLWRRGQGDDPECQSWNHPSWQNPHLPRDDIEKERERLPERVFRQEYGGQFIEGMGQVFRNVRELATGSFQEPSEGRHYYAGLDLAKVADFSVLVILDDRYRVVFVDRFQKLDWTHQVNRIRAALERYGNAVVLTDSTGAGEPVLEALREAGCAAEPYTFTQPSKAALVSNLQLMIERKQLVLPKPEVCPELIDELEAFEYSVSDAGTVRESAPSGMHDDCVMALGLAAMNIGPDSGEMRIEWAGASL